MEASEVRTRYSRESRETDHRSDDLARCLEIGQRVLKLLEEGVHRVEVYGHPGKERVDGVKLAS